MGKNKFLKRNVGFLFILPWLIGFLVFKFVLKNCLPENGDSHASAQNGRDIICCTEKINAFDLKIQDIGDEQSRYEL